MNIRLRFMVVTAAVVILPLYSAVSAQVGQGAQQDDSLEGRISQLQQEVQADSRNPDLHFELSKLYEENVDKYYDESLSEFGLAVNHGLKNKHFEWTDPTIFLVSQGTNYLIKEGEYDKAIASYEKVIKLTPNNPHPYGGIGQAHQYKGDYDEAIRWLKQAIDAYKKYLEYDKGDQETKDLIIECERLLRQSR